MSVELSARDNFWRNICVELSNNTKCLSRKVGAVIAKENKYIISTGYNGPCTGAVHCDDTDYRQRLASRLLKDGVLVDFDYLIEMNGMCPRKIIGYNSSEGLKYCQAAHAERNAIDMAARLGHSVNRLTMYLNYGLPCIECAKSIVNSGIKELVVADEDDVYEKSGWTGKDILNFGGVEIREYEV